MQDRDTVTQLAPFLYILSGNYDGALTVAQYKAAGNFGIGTFEGLDGEAVLLDGVVYQVKGDGSVARYSTRSHAALQSRRERLTGGGP